jgi:hypothetical protein
MPLDPRGLGERVFNRVVDRVRRQLGVEPVAPVAPVGEEPQPGVIDRVQQLVRQRLGLEPQVEQAPPYYGPPRSLEEVKQRIQQAGRQMPPVLLRMEYNGNYRDVEPYSYRYRDAEDPHIPLFYGYCHKDNQIEAFKLKKITDLQVTAQPFQPRWVVEF